jgi:hypothetical protein
MSETSGRRLGPFRHRETCRGCESRNLERVLSLGPTALANAFLRSADLFDEELVYPLDVHVCVYPLDVHVCVECSLMQLLDVVDAAVLFGEYIYVSGTSETVRAHNAALAQHLTDRRGLQEGDLVVEIASNDGSLLKCFRECGTRTLGVEPAKNIAELARSDGIVTISRFFDSDLASEVHAEHGPVSVVVANNVLAHVDEPRDFLQGCRILLEGGDGLVVVEVPYVRDLLDRVEYDTIYHEHLSYFSVTTIFRLMSEAGLTVQSVEHIPIHGGSLRICANPSSEAGLTVQSVEHIPIHGGSLRICAKPSRPGEGSPVGVLELLEAEEKAGLTRLETYELFERQVEESRQATLRLLDSLRGSDAAVAGYGAPAKGNTLLNYCGITTDLLPYTVDRNPLKVELFTPGAHIPVLPYSVLSERRPDCLFLLAWNFAEEIMRQESAFADRGGKFILPVPLARMVTP